MAWLETKDYRHFSLYDSNGALVKSVEGYDSIRPAYPGDLVDPETYAIIHEEAKPAIVGVLHITSKVIYGMTSRNVPIYYFEPLDSKYPPMVVGCSVAKDYSKNILVLVKFDAWLKGSKFPRGNLQTILGECGNIHAEKTALLHKYSPWPVKNYTFRGAAYRDALDQPKLAGFTFNIDPVGCEDVDDIFTVKRGDYGDWWELTISITDVAAANDPPFEDDIFRKSLLNGQTLYPDNRPPKHMIPPEIGISLLSLLPGKLRSVISLTVAWSPTYGIRNQGFSLQTAVVDQSYTYEEANLENREEFKILETITNTLSNKSTTDSHEIVEQLMLFYNTEAGKLLKQYKCGILRGHDEPKKEKLEYLTALHPDLKFLGFSSAKYISPDDNTSHWGIGAEAYAHASSPLRRCADMYNQLCLRSILEGGHSPELPPWLNYPTMLRSLNMLQKYAKDYERDIFFINKLLSETEKQVSGILVDGDTLKNKLKIYIPSWKRIVGVKGDLVKDGSTIFYISQDATKKVQYELGQEITLSYYYKPDSSRWKDKIIFTILKV